MHIISDRSMMRDNYAYSELPNGGWIGYPVNTTPEVPRVASWAWPCPFKYRRRKHFSFGVDPGFLDYCDELDDEAEAKYNRKYPTCWRKFLHWLDVA